MGCSVHKHREYVPIESHHIVPKSSGGSNDSSNLIDICANAHSAVHEYIRLLTKYNGNPPTFEKLRFGYKVKKLAKRGYNAQG